MKLNEPFQISLQGSIEFALNTDNEQCQINRGFTNKGRKADATMEYVALVKQLKG